MAGAKGRLTSNSTGRDGSVLGLAGLLACRGIRDRHEMGWQSRLASLRAWPAADQAVGTTDWCRSCRPAREAYRWFH